MIPDHVYRLICEHSVVLCVDMIVRDSRDQVLLVRRANDPLKGEWWVVGGRVHKGETLLAAALRKAREELGAEISYAYPVGYYEEVYPDKHTVSIVFETQKMPGEITLDDQSSDWRWSTELPARFQYVRL